MSWSLFLHYTSSAKGTALCWPLKQRVGIRQCTEFIFLCTDRAATISTEQKPHLPQILWLRRATNQKKVGLNSEGMGFWVLHKTNWEMSRMVFMVWIILQLSVSQSFHLDKVSMKFPGGPDVLSWSDGRLTLNPLWNHVISYSVLFFSCH